MGQGLRRFALIAPLAAFLPPQTMTSFPAMESCMRVVVLAVCFATLAGTAVAQPASRVVIEDDVAPATALACAALRLAQADNAKRAGAVDAIAAASAEAWLASGVDAGAARQEARKLDTLPPAALAAGSDTCATFEIRQATPSGS